MHVNVIVIVSEFNLASVLTDASEGIGYWASDWTSRGAESASKSVAAGKTSYVIEGDPRTRHRLGRAELERGLALLAAKYPSRFASVVEGNTDREDGDVLIQLCIFGEIKYG